MAAREVDAAAWHGRALSLLQSGELAEARSCLERLVALQPGSSTAHNNLGLVLQQLGEAAEAAQQYGIALSLDPDNAAIHGNLAAVQSELGEYEAALGAARRALDLDAKLVGPHVFAAIAESGLGRNDAALLWLDRAAVLAPDNVAVLVARANALRLADQIEEGLRCCQRATELDPSNGEAFNGLGLLLDALGRQGEALAAFDRAIALMPAPAVALANKAALLLQEGERDEALAATDRALSLDPQFALAWYNRADAKTFTAGDPDIVAMEQVLQEDEGRQPRGAGAREHGRLLLHYALGKAYLDSGDGARAFTHLHRGSRIKRSSLAYDADASAHVMEAIAAACPAPLFAQFAGAGNPTELPVFVVGMPRSGTTLIEQILASHPQVHGGGEPNHIENLARAMGGPGYGAVGGSWSPARIAEFAERYLALMPPPAASVRRHVDKMPSNFLHAGLIHLTMPKARIIHARRDPVDTCLSCYSKLFATGQEFSYDLAELGRYYRSYERLMAHWRAVLPRDRFIEIDYETLVPDFETEVRRLLAFCGLRWDDVCLRFYETRRTIRTASKMQVRQPLYGSSIGRWKSFAAELVPLIEALGRSK